MTKTAQRIASRGKNEDMHWKVRVFLFKKKLFNVYSNFYCATMFSLKLLICFCPKFVTVSCRQRPTAWTVINYVQNGVVPAVWCIHPLRERKFINLYRNIFGIHWFNPTVTINECEWIRYFSAISWPLCVQISFKIASFVNLFSSKMLNSQFLFCPKWISYVWPPFNVDGMVRQLCSMQNVFLSGDRCATSSCHHKIGW